MSQGGDGDFQDIDNKIVIIGLLFCINLLFFFCIFYIREKFFEGNLLDKFKMLNIDW